MKEGRVLTLLLIFLRPITSANPTPKSTSNDTSHVPFPLTSLEELDDFHRELLKSKILKRLSLDEPPAPSQPWLVAQEQRRNLSHPIIPELNPPEPPPLQHYFLRILPKSSNAHFENQTENCQSTFTFDSQLIPRTRGKVFEHSSGEVWIPSKLWAVKTGLELKSDDGTPLVISASNKSRDGYQLLDLTSALFATGSNRISFSLSIASSPPVDDGSCSEFQTENTPFVLIRMEETRPNPQRQGHQKRNAPGGGGADDLVIDCEQQWDRDLLTDTSVRGILPCCRRKVLVDFASIGWNHWLVAPEQFHSYYCLGRCSAFGGFATDETEGQSFYAEIMNFKKLKLSPCCTPVKFRPLTVTVLTGEQEEMTQTLEDVVVDSCGCL